MWSTIWACIALVEALPIAQDETNSGISAPEVENGPTPEILEEPGDSGSGGKFEGSQLGLALALSDAKPQPVSSSSYGGRRKRESQLLIVEEQANTSVPPEVQDARSEYLRKRFEGSSLGLALALSNAKPQPISESSYGGKRRRSPQDPDQAEVAEPGLQESEQEDAPGQNQLALALELSNAKPQAVSESSYGGKRKRSPQDPEQAEVAEPGLQESEQEEASGQNQLALALALSNAKPQPVSESSYGGKRKRSPQDPEQPEVAEPGLQGSEQEDAPTEGTEPTLQAQTPEDKEKQSPGQSQLALALALSNAKPQPVSASSYGGKRKRSPQDPEQTEGAERGLQGSEQEDAHSQNQLALALELSNAKPQAVGESSYGGRRKRSPQDPEQPEDAEPTLQAQTPEDEEKQSPGQSQLALALAISNAKPQAVSESSYGGRR